MKDSLPTVWSADAHTIAKHQILLAYISAWLPILSNTSQRFRTSESAIKYVDGFAGPGVYENGHKGSPILALEAALNHVQEFPVPVELIFIEDNAERFAVLETQLATYATKISSSKNVHRVTPIRGDCRKVIDDMLATTIANRQKFGPALVFLDQFGYSAVPMDLVGRILAHPQCEVLTFFFWRELNRFITDPTKHAGVTSAFGGVEWLPAIEMDGAKRQQFMQNNYVRSLKERAKAKYVWPFAMADANHQLLCWLFFCTNNLRGLEVMKKSMWTVDNSGGFSFSDRDGLGQLSLLSDYVGQQLEREMERSLAGRTMAVQEIREWVLTETPAYLFKGPLAALEKRGVVTAVSPPPGRQAGKYPNDDLVLRFAMAPLF